MHRHKGSRTLGWATTALLGAVICMPAPAHATPPARFDVRIEFFGISKPSKRKSSPQKPHRLSATISYWADNTDHIPAGGLAAWGAFGPGDVRLMHYVAYVPSLAESYTAREIPLSASEQPAIQNLPRYILTCAWPADDPGLSIFTIYTERDDVASSSRDGRLSVQWRTVPSRRARDKFAGHDYCGEIAQTKESSAPLWLPGAEGK